MVNQDESRDIYFVTDMKRESVILAATTEALLHQSILDQIESKKIRNAGGYRLFRTTESELQKILLTMKRTHKPFYLVAKLRR